MNMYNIYSSVQSFHKLCYRCANCKKSINGANFSEHDGNLYDNSQIQLIPIFFLSLFLFQIVTSVYSVRKVWVLEQVQVLCRQAISPDNRYALKLVLEWSRKFFLFYSNAALALFSNRYQNNHRRFSNFLFVVL